MPTSHPRWSLRYHTPPVVADAPRAIQGAVDLILDDGSREADFGVSDLTAAQFLWFNLFAVPIGGIDIDEIQVLFPPGPEVVPGAAIQLVVWVDDDGDPATGAELLATFDETIQVADGTTFSTYALAVPVSVPANARDVLIGVVNRFVISGVSPPSRPAALDTSSTAGRSWLALWIGDPPDPPQLPTDDFLDTIDFLEPGNWMIRAAGSAVAGDGDPDSQLGRLGGPGAHPGDCRCGGATLAPGSGVATSEEFGEGLKLAGPRRQSSSGRIR